MKTNNHYDNVLEKARALINEDNNTEAMKILKEELSMPYIPEKYEIQFQNLYEELFHAIVKEIKNTAMTPEKLIELLNTGDPIKESMAVDEIKNINARVIANQLKEWIDKHGDEKQIGKAFIIESLIEQKVDIDLELNSVKINPSKDTSVLETEEVKAAFAHVDEVVEKTPQLRDVVFSELKRYLLSTYPIVPEDGKLLVIDIKTILFKLYGNEIELNDRQIKVMDILNVKNF